MLRAAFLIELLNHAFYIMFGDLDQKYPTEAPEDLMLSMPSDTGLQHLRPCSWCYFPSGTFECRNGCHLATCLECYSRFRNCPACYGPTAIRPHHVRPPAATKRRSPPLPPLLAQPSLLSACIQWSDTVPADYNIGFFYHWIQRQLFDAQIIYMTVLYVITHTGGADTAESYKLGDGNLYKLRHIKCDKSNCVRCQHRQGGFRFGWQGPWTCHRSMSSHASPQAARASTSLCAVLNLCTACINRSAPVTYVAPKSIARTLQPHLIR